MEKIKRRFKKNNYKLLTYTIHTQKEADQYELKYKPWREVSVGEYGISDDGYVAECIYVNKYENATLVTYPYGRQWINNTSKLEFIPHKLSGEFGQVGTRSWAEQELGKTRTKNAIKLYVQMMLNEGKIDWKKLGLAYRKDQERPELTARRLFKSKRIQSMLDKELASALKEKNIDKGDVLDMLLDAIKIAKEKEDPSNMLRGAENFVKIMDMLPSKSMITDTVQIDMTSKILNDIAKEEKSSLTLSQTKENPNEEEDNEVFSDPS